MKIALIAVMTLMVLSACETAPQPDSGPRATTKEGAQKMADKYCAQYGMRANPTGVNANGKLGYDCI